MLDFWSTHSSPIHPCYGTDVRQMWLRPQEVCGVLMEDIYILRKRQHVNTINSKIIKVLEPDFGKKVSATWSMLHPADIILFKAVTRNLTPVGKSGISTTVTFAAEDICCASFPLFFSLIFSCSPVGCHINVLNCSKNNQQQQQKKTDSN